MVDNPASAEPVDEEAGRRDFLVFAATAMGVVGAGSFVWPLIQSMNPSAEVLALSSTELDLEPIEVGQAVTIVWQGKPIFVRRRTAEEIATAKKDDSADFRDPQTDADRVQKAEWLVVIGICTHLGCIPLGQKSTEPKGDYNGWFCPCHGSHYDTSGRIRRGPAPLNLELPPYEFLSDTNIRIG